MRVAVEVVEGELELALGVVIPRCMLRAGINKHGDNKFTFGSRGLQCTAPIFGGALGAPHTGFGKSSVSFCSSSLKRYLIGLGFFFIFFGASNKSIS